MSSKVKRNVRLAICGIICMMFVAISFSIAMGRSNSTQDLIPSTTVILGKWSQDHTRIGWGNYAWDVQLINTGPSCLKWTAGGEQIIIMKSGYYQININVCQYFPYQVFSHPNAGVVYLKRNNVVLSTSQCDGVFNDTIFNHHFSDIGYFNAYDVVSVYSQSSNEPYANRFGGDVCSSTMNIVRLN